MKIESISGGRLRVWLDQREVRRCRLDHPHYDRRALRRLVRHALSQGGATPSHRMVAEMIPVADGWVLLISPRREQNRRTEVYWFADWETVTSLIARWERMGDAPSCALYALSEGYAVTVFGDSPLTSRHSALLNEYGQPWGVGETLAAHVAEYGQLLFAGHLTVDGHHPPTDEDRGN